MPKTRAKLRYALQLILAVFLLVGAAQGPALAAPSWDYVAHGDSLATGFGAFKGYVPRYRDHVVADTRATVTLTNRGQNGWTSSQLLNALRSDQNFRLDTSKAEVVTLDIGGNDLRSARTSYKNRTCGGADNQDCLRNAVRDFGSNWDNIIAEVSGLRPPGNTAIIRTMDIYNPYVKTDKASDTWPNDGGNDFQIFKQHLDAVNNHIATTTTRTGIPAPYAKVYLAFNGPNGDQDPGAKRYLSFDRLHPNDTGHRVMAAELRKLGYSPLYPPSS